MKLIYNRNFAFIILILSVCGSVYLGAMKDFNGFHTKARQIFENGDANDGLSILTEMAKMKENAFDLATIAKTAPEISIDAISRMTLYAEIMCSEIPFADKPAAMEKVYNEAESLHKEIIESSIETDYKSLADAVMSSINSRYNVILKDPYNERVEKMNQAMTGFPGGLLKTVTFSKYIEYFK